MSIRAKVVAWVAAFFAVLIFLQVIIQNTILLPSFLELERSDARTSMTRVRYAFERSLEALEVTACDWSDWGELHQFIQDRNPAFLAAYMTPTTLSPLKLNLLMLLDLDGKVVFSLGRDLETGEPLAIDFAALRELPSSFPWRQSMREGKSMRGLVPTDRGVMLLAAAPILDGSGKGRPVGTTLMGRLLTRTQLAALGRQAQADIAMDSGTDPPTGDLVGLEHATRVLQGFDDIHGRPLLTLRVDVPREISVRGHAAVTYSLTYLIGAAATVSVLLLIILNRVVLEPIRRVTRHAVRIGEGADLTARLAFTGRDEISRLAQEFDRMVDKVAHSRRELIDRSFQEGFAELAQGVMHNLGNALTPLGVRVVSLSDHLKAAPASDLVAAAAQLEPGRAAAERRAALSDFLVAGVLQVDAARSAAAADIAVIQRQAALVTSTLSEQTASARNEAVVEAVQLPDLIAQSLDIVPDDCRSNLTIEIDASLRAVGTVTVARTVLRLVLQNLIINASQAVRAAARERGTLRITAEVSGGEPARMLHLGCTDDGAGIAAEHLQRIFEKGFSTKSRATNHGIGLHWCANAIHALGGRISATSEGPDRGATLSVVLPLAPQEHAARAA